MHILRLAFERSRRALNHFLCWTAHGRVPTAEGKVGIHHRDGWRPEKSNGARNGGCGRVREGGGAVRWGVWGH